MSQPHVINNKQESEASTRTAAAHQFVAVYVHGVVAFTILQGVAAKVVCSGDVVLCKGGRLNHEPFRENEDLGLWFFARLLGCVEHATSEGYSA